MDTSLHFKTCPTCNSGKPCKEIEALLQSEGIRSRNWIRPKLPNKKRQRGSIWREIPFTDLNFEDDLTPSP